MARIEPKKLRKYFTKRFNPATGILYLVLLALLIFAAMTAFRQFAADLMRVGILIEAIFVLIIIIRLLRGGRSSITDEEIDEQFRSDVDGIIKTALDKLGLDKDELPKNRKEPLLIPGPILWSTPGIDTKDILWKKGKDGQVRFSINKITVIYFSNYLLACYSCDYNFLKNINLNEKTDEYYYRDIVSVSTSENSTSYTLPNGIKLTHSQEFRLSISNGDAIRVTINAEKLSKITNGKIPTDEAEKAVKVIRTMLKEKKQ